ncbi:hypothetical protein Pflav_063370 [Phytohabitans flavus]|uniref:Uncharacterized protein n=1 Tax=Phytohabitans flavus TaxID=1076124 RepID=A0A6F8Y1J6_9ACTN|nr:hypothetical protein Pflav_063370 [Phytohabitans flavus]
MFAVTVKVTATVPTTTALHFRGMEDPSLLSRRAVFGLVPSPADDEPKQYEVDGNPPRGHARQFATARTAFFRHLETWRA